MGSIARRMKILHVELYDQFENGDRLERVSLRSETCIRYTVKALAHYKRVFLGGFLSKEDIKNGWGRLEPYKYCSIWWWKD